MRTTQEIAEYYRKHRDGDLFGFAAEVLLPYLSADELKPFLKEGAGLSDWKQEPLIEDELREEMQKYMAFAWEKCICHRGISASRSITKMKAWLWLLGDDELLAFAQDDANYAQYGAPILLAISEKYGFEHPADKMTLRMTRGEPCYEGCEQGCDR